MEKRAMLALGLTLVVLFLFQMYFAPKEQQQPQKVEPQKAEQKKEIPAPPGGVLPAKLDTKQTPPGQPTKDVLVETRLLKVKLTGLGGAVSSVQLKDYRETVKETKEKEVIEDIKPYTDIPKLAVSAGGQTTDDRTPFKTDKTNVVVQDMPVTVVMSGALSDGRGVKKSYTFYPDGYTIDVKVEVGSREGDRPFADLATLSDKKGQDYNFRGPFVFDGKKLEQIEKIEKNLEYQNYRYAGFDEGYFASIWIPDSTLKMPMMVLKADTNIPVIRVALDSGVLAGKMYFGPKRTDILKALNIGAEKIVDFGWFDIIAKPMIAGLNYCNKVTHNYGIDIILLTILIKIIFYPLTVKSYKSMKEMQKLQPQVAKLREKFKDDKQKLNQEMMDLYRKKGVNPMGGCFPMLIQIPVFFALYKALSGAIEMRHAHFLWWMNDLSAPEDLFSFTVAGYVLPIRILPLVMGITQVIQQKMTPTGGDPMQEKMMLLMPIVFTFLFWGFPSGLVLYWLVNNVISIGQQYYINKKAS
jgi:YidC/Oxa1 family membrane protein insertase